MTTNQQNKRIKECTLNSKGFCNKQKCIICEKGYILKTKYDEKIRMMTNQQNREEWRKSFRDMFGSKLNGDAYFSSPMIDGILEKWIAKHIESTRQSAAKEAREEALKEVFEIVNSIDEGNCINPECKRGYDGHEYKFVLGRREFKEELITKLQQLTTN